jgi:PIN domain nuclease of toxin-antitoxin system
MIQPILLDTCAVLFMLSRQLKPSARDMLEEASENDATICISPVTTWEIGILISHATDRCWITHLGGI